MSWPVRMLLVMTLLVGVGGVVLFGVRLYRTWEVMRSAEAARAPDTAGIRGWMTVAYVAATYGVPEDALAERLDVPSEMAERVTLRGLALQRGQSSLALIAETQRVIAELRGVSRFAPTPRRIAAGVGRSTG